MGDMVVLQTYQSEVEAQIAAAFLETHGIRCNVMADDLAGLCQDLSMSSGVKLTVSCGDHKKAKDLLENPWPAQQSQSVKDSGYKANAQKALVLSKKHRAIYFATGIIVGLLLGYNGYYYSNVERDILDINNDGRIDTEYVYVGDALKETMHDKDFNGRFDLFYEYSGPYAGKVIQDYNLDGKIDSWAHFKYDINETTETDLDGNGIADSFCSFENGFMKECELRVNNSVTVEKREIYYQNFSRDEYIDQDKDGHFDRVDHFDQYGYLTGSETIKRL